MAPLPGGGLYPARLDSAAEKLLNITYCVPFLPPSCLDEGATGESWSTALAVRASSPLSDGHLTWELVYPDWDPMGFRVNYAIVFVSDMEQSVAFYRDLLGLPLRYESPHWTEFATDGATLALHASDEPGVDRSGVQRERPGSCRPGLSVPNLDEFHQRMVANGVTCLQEPKELFGSRLAQYSDPDGLAISVGEHQPADVDT